MNNAAGVLAAPGLAIGAPTFTLTLLADADEFGPVTPVTIDDEIIYCSRSGVTFTVLERGAEGTTEAVHAAGAAVEQNFNAAFMNAAYDGIKAIQAKLGVGAGAPTVGKFLVGDTVAGSSEWRLAVAGDIPDLSGTYSILGHSHAIADVTGLQAALDGKANSSHTHAVGDITGFAAAVAVVGDALYSPLAHNHSGVYEPANANIQAHIASTSNPHSVTAAQVGLGSVENTALSTWAGSTNLTTVGTIGTGVWQGTPVADSYIASAATWNAKAMANSTVGVVPYLSATGVFSNSPITRVSATEVNIAALTGVDTATPLNSFDVYGYARVGAATGSDKLWGGGSTTVAVAMTAGQTTMEVAAIPANFPQKGLLQIASDTLGNSYETVAYTSWSGTTFSGLTRGVHGSTAETHAIGKTVIVIEAIVHRGTSVAPTLLCTSGGSVFVNTADNSLEGVSTGVTLFKFKSGTFAFSHNPAAGAMTVTGATTRSYWGLQDGTAVFFGSHSSHPLYVRVANANRHAFSTTGHLGIDTLTPAARLHAVQADAGTTNVLALGIFCHNSSATTLTNFGGEIRGQARVATTNDKDLFGLTWQIDNATLATYTSYAGLHAYDYNAKREAIQIGANGTVATIGFLGATRVARPASYTVAGSATRTFPTDPSGAYSGIDNAQGGTPYAQLTDLNTLRGVVSSLEGVVRQLVTDLGSTSGFGLLAHS